LSKHFSLHIHTPTRTHSRTLTPKHVVTIKKDTNLEEGNIFEN
jgi:hypothetical protein